MASGDSNFGMPNTSTTSERVKANLPCMDKHPLESIDMEALGRQSDLAMARSVQGLHMPLRLQMEAFLSKRSSRLPGLPTSNLHYEVLVGKDVSLDFDDIFAKDEFGRLPSDSSKLLEEQSVHQLTEEDLDNYIAKKAAAKSL